MAYMRALRKLIEAELVEASQPQLNDDHIDPHRRQHAAEQAVFAVTHMDGRQHHVPAASILTTGLAGDGERVTPGSAVVTDRNKADLVTRSLRHELVQAQRRALEMIRDGFWELPLRQHLPFLNADELAALLCGHAYAPRGRISDLFVLEPMEEIERLQKQIVAQIIGLKCPRCAAEFAGYAGEDAVQCTTCGAGFCPLCLTDCNSDARHHAEYECELHAPLEDGGGPALQSRAWTHFNHIHRERRQREVTTFMDALQLTEGMRTRVLSAAEEDLVGLGVD
eukprot:gene23552-28519_t